MTSERWHKIEAIFQAALDLSGEERERFISRECAADAELRVEVEKLVARYGEEDSFLESPVWSDSQMLQSGLKKEIAASLDELKPAERVEPFSGRRIGAYRLTEELGKGGMGVVYLAERADGEFRQKVAIKLIKRGMDTDFILRRFRQERQIAAALNHPNIARLLDGGTTPDDLPYFVMEYVEGQGFFKYAQTHHLNLREKLQLFLQVCAAIAYAHKRRIIHRDIKPGNILVTEDGMPKLLDFGIAKILDPDLIHESIMPTATQMRLMTPEYASPEQIKGDEITLASDQYSLGVLLYELLTGSRPYKFTSREPREIARIICEELPSEPSSGEYGKIEIGDLKLDSDFCQKLDRIALKSLRKGPAERYASVTEFAADIERFLRNEPIRAEITASERNQAPPENYFRSPAASTKTLRPITPNQKSIAVLPFKILNMLSAETNTAADGEFLGIGLADALITRLSNVRQFLVRPTSSILSYGDRSVESFQAGTALNVQFVLDGSIIRTNTRLRVSVQLLSVAEQRAIWAERFDEEAADILSLEDSISERVAELIVPQLSTIERENLAKRATDNAKAYEYYLRGRAIWNTFSGDSFRQANLYFQRAIEIDPNFALAYAGIADYHIWRGIYGFLPTAEFCPPAKEAALQAIRLDPQLSEGYAALGLAALYREYDWNDSEKQIRRAIELNPNNAVAHLWYSNNLCSQRRFTEALREAEITVELDPLSFQSQNTLAFSFYCLREMGKALDCAEQLVEQFPAVGHAHATRGTLLSFAGRSDESMLELRRAAELASNEDAGNFELMKVLAAEGKRAEIEAIIEKNRVQPVGRVYSEFQQAFIYNRLKDKQMAIDCLERAFENHESLLVWIAAEPTLDFLQDEPRYLELLRKMNHPAFAAIYKKSIKQQTAIEDSRKKSNLPFSPDQKSIAVLPLKILDAGALSETDDIRFLSIGLADSLITRLSNIRQLIVRPTSSVLRYGEQDSDSLAAGEELGVKFVLSGGLMCHGDNLRVTIQLLDITTKAVVWAERFDEKITDVLELEDLISVKVVELLLPRLSSRERKNLAKRGTENLEAYEAYLRGRFYWNLVTEEGFQQAILYYKKAVELDPKYALAHAAIADYYNWLGIYAILPRAEFYQPAKEAARRAIELDPELPEAHAALGLVYLYGDYNWQSSDQEIRRAIELNPNNSLAHLWYTHNLYTARRFETGRKNLDRAVKLDPPSFHIRNTQVWSYYYPGEVEKALSEADRLVKDFPFVSHAYFARGYFLNYLGRTEEAMQAMSRALELSDDRVIVNRGISLILAAQGKRREVEKMIAAEGATGKQKMAAFEVALAYAYLGDKDKVFEYLEKSFCDHESLLIWIATEPALDSVRDDERYQSLLRKIKHPLAELENSSTEIKANAITEFVDSISTGDSETETIIQPIKDEKKKMPKSLKYLLAVIGLIILSCLIYFIDSH